MAQRRLRQLGMLAAIGATRRHLRLVLLANGAVIGTTAAGLGTIIGLGAWLLVADRVEVWAGRRDKSTTLDGIPVSRLPYP